MQKCGRKLCHFSPSSFKISCVAAFSTDSLSQFFFVLTLLLIFSWVLIITSLAGSRVPALLELSLCCCHDSREQTLCLLPSGRSSSFLFWSKVSLTFNHYGSITRLSQPGLLAFKVWWLLFSFVWFWFFVFLEIYLPVQGNSYTLFWPAVSGRRRSLPVIIILP